MFFDEATKPILEGEQLKNPQELEHAIVEVELDRMITDENREAFLNSAECKELVEAGLVSKKTLIRLSKADDVRRRRKMAAFQIAKEKNDPLWKALLKNRIRERALIKGIMAKYHSTAERNAKVAQRAYLKVAKMAPMSYTDPNAQSLKQKEYRINRGW